MSENDSASGGGIGFLGLLTIAFIVLKLLGHIEWSWFWVLSPLMVVPAILAIVGIVFLVAHIFDTIDVWRRRRQRENG